MWTKGAVVIKYGDEEWANKMENSIRDIQSIPLPERMSMQAVQNEIYKKYYTDYWTRKIRKAKRKYGYNKAPSKIGGAILYAWAWLTNAGDI